MNAALKKERIYFDFSQELYFFDLKQQKFGFCIMVVLQNDTEIPIPYLCEWYTDYGEKYYFILFKIKYNWRQNDMGGSS